MSGRHLITKEELDRISRTLSVAQAEILRLRGALREIADDQIEPRESPEVRLQGILEHARYALGIG